MKWASECLEGSVQISRVLIVGLGSIGRRHLRLARELLPKADIRVLRHQDGQPTPEYANGCFSLIENALEFAPQIAVIASPATFHLKVAISLAQSGVHILVEKPLAASLDGVQLLLDTCRARGLVLLIGYNLRFLPSLEGFRSLLLKKRVGKVISLRVEIGQYLPSWRPDTDYRLGVSARRELGGGALLELSHEIDYLRWIFGEVEWVNATLSRQSDLDINVEDTAHMILGFTPDADGHRLIGTLNMDFIRQDTVRRCVAIGKSGSLSWDGLTGVVTLLEAGSTEWRELFRYPHHADDSYRAEWVHFLACVREKCPPLISGEDGFRVMQIIAATREASESGGQIKVAEKQANIEVDA